MSLSLNFEPHSWYRGFAIKHNDTNFKVFRWSAYTDDGNTYQIVELNASTLRGLKQKIADYHERHRMAGLQELLP